MREKISPQQFADRLGVDVRKVHKWIKSGELKAMDVSQITGKRPQLRIGLEEVQRFENAREYRPDTKPRRTKATRFGIPRGRLLTRDELRLYASKSA